MLTSGPADSDELRNRFSVSDVFLLIAFAATCLLYVQIGLSLRYDSGLAQFVVCTIVFSLPILLFGTGFAFWTLRFVCMVFYVAIVLCFSATFQWAGVLLTVGGIALYVQYSAMLRKSAPGSNFRRLLVMYSLTLVAATLVGSLFHNIMPSRRLEALWKLRSEYPIQDLSNRLPTFGNAVHVAPGGKPVELPALFRELEDSFAVIQEQSLRNIVLSQIHDRQYEAFVHREGFGKYRMLLVSGRHVGFPELQSIALSDSNIDVLEGSRIKRHKDSKRESNGQLDSMDDVLAWSYFDFAYPQSLGETVAKSNAVGFIEHSFLRSLPEVVIDEQSYSISRLQLMGQVHSDSPVVYEMDHLPRMDQIANGEAKQRSLNDFERDALVRLFEGSTIVSGRLDSQRDMHSIQEGAASSFLMLGAIRAIEQCTTCHGCEQGELLGAFSYEFEPLANVRNVSISYAR